MSTSTYTPTFKFACRVANTNPEIPLTVRILVDDQVLFESNNIEQPTMVRAKVEDKEGADRVLRIELSGKQDSHTKIDENGKILSDATVKLDCFELEDLDVNSIVYSVSRYTHDTNGHDTLKEYPFYGEMGCNGVVEMKFTTPIYVWMLEHI